MIGDRDANFKASDFRGNFKQIIAKRSDLKQTQSIRLVAADAGETLTYQAGTLLAKVTSSGLYTAYDDASETAGVNVAVGILEATTEVDENSNGSLAVMLRHATVFKDLLVGYDAAGLVDLAGKVYVENGVNLLEF